MRAIDKLHSERTRHAWEAILRYANARDEAGAARELRKILFTLEPRLADEGPSWMSLFADNPARHSAPDSEANLPLLAFSYQPEFGSALSYLIEPQRYSPTSPIDDIVSRFLMTHGHGKRWELVHCTKQPNLDEDSEAFSPYLFVRRTVSYSSLMVPVVQFLLEQMDEWGVLDRTIPIRQCRYCWKFMFADRPRRRRYCSNLCGALDRQRDRSPAEWRDYIWLRRLEKTKGGVRNKKLARPETIARLRAIAEEYPKLSKRAEDLLSRNPDKIPS